MRLGLEICAIVLDKCTDISNGQSWARGRWRPTQAERREEKRKESSLRYPLNPGGNSQVNTLTTEREIEVQILNLVAIAPIQLTP